RCLLFCSMDEFHRKLLRVHMVALVKDLDPPSLYPHLLQGGVLSQDDIDSIDAKSIRRNKAIELMSVLPMKGPDAFAGFVAAL
ncbi:hypothetical protein CAPTEDRAFT_58959, partial [Capitella teleta]